MKAKDLRGKNIEDFDSESEEPKEDEDAVTAAYENISKKLDSIRKGGDEDDSEESDESKESEEKEPELEEWKGPRPPRKEDLRPQEPEEEEEEYDLRKVKLTNLEVEESKVSEESEESEDDEDSDEESKRQNEDDEEEVTEKKDKKWEPEDNDPLDEEEDSEDEDKQSLTSNEDEDKQSLTSKEDEELEEKVDKEEEEEEPRVKKSEQIDVEEKFEASESRGERNLRDDNSEVEDLDAEMPMRKEEDPDGFEQPNNLDDLADESPFVKSGRDEARDNRGEEEEDGYAIPNLRSSRHEAGGMGYNTHPQREGVGQSYAPRGNNMDGNDPNNYFNSHQQPQPVKRANKFHLLILVVIGIAVIGFTVYVLKGGFGDIQIGTAEPSPSPAASATPEPTPTPTPEPEIERANFTVKVLNGTTTSGLAGKVRDALKEKGYKTATPGNASDTDMEQTEIRVKEGTESAALFERLKLDLAPDYDAKQGEELDSKASYDAEVIIGAK